MATRQFFDLHENASAVPTNNSVKRGYGERGPRMPALRITHRQRRTFISTLFGLTFFASVLTVSASNVLPCPVRPDRNYHADSERKARGGGSTAVVEKRPRRWIQEKDVTEH